MITEPARLWLVVLLLVEAAGALLLALLNLVTSRALGQTVLPWQAAFVPGLFGVLCVMAGAAVARGKGWGGTAAIVVSILVLAGGVLGLVYSRHPALWAALLLGAGGVLLARAVAAGEVRPGEAGEG